MRLASVNTENDIMQLGRHADRAAVDHTLGRPIEGGEGKPERFVNQPHEERKRYGLLQNIG